MHYLRLIIQHRGIGEAPALYCQKTNLLPFVFLYMTFVEWHFLAKKIMLLGIISQQYFFPKTICMQCLRRWFAYGLVTVLKDDLSFSWSQINCKSALKVLISLPDCSLHKTSTGKDLGFLHAFVEASTMISSFYLKHWQFSVQNFNF